MTTPMYRHKAKYRLAFWPDDERLCYSRNIGQITLKIIIMIKDNVYRIKANPKIGLLDFENEMAAMITNTNLRCC